MMDCGKAGDFRLVSGMLTHINGRAGEVVEALSDRKLSWYAFKNHNGKVMVASSMEVKAKDISCSGWEVRRDRLV